MKLRLHKFFSWEGRNNSKCFERCVLCHKEVMIPKDMPVSERQWYVQGAGQLCEECYRSIYPGRAMDVIPNEIKI